MPTYEFQCCKCQEITERDFKISECPKMIPCPKCNHMANKIMSIPSKPGFIFESKSGGYFAG